MKRFEKMLQESLISENLIKDFLTMKFNLQFHCVPHIEQKAMISKNVHVPDILCVEKPHVAFEVKEDLMCAKTGNICFELECLARLRLWGLENEIRNIYLLYVNHKDFGLDVFELGMGSARLEFELDSRAQKDNEFRLVTGGDWNKELYLVPLAKARTLHSCITKRFFDNVDLFLFAKSAQSKLKR